MKNNIVEKYSYRVEWSEEDATYLSSCAELPTLQAHGKTMELALKHIKQAVKATVAWMQEEKEPLPDPFGTRQFKGHLTLRTSPDVHRKLAVLAAEQKISINQFILSRLSLA